MAGIPAHPRDRAALRDIQTLRRRGLTWAEVAAQMGMSLATLKRIRTKAGL